MAFYESPRFPDDIAYGATGGPAWSTDVVQTASGYERRNINWSSARRKYDVGYVRTQAQLDALVAFFHAMRGRAHGFRFRDPADYRATVNTGLIGTGFGDGTPGPHQLIKRYVSGSQTTDRGIRKPIGSTVKVYKAGVLQTPGAHYTLDDTTGLVTWIAVASQSITSHTPGAAHQFTTAGNLSGLGVGSRVYLSGITGTASVVLNAKAHVISNKTGTGPYTWTISANTSGLTASGGTAAEYPQTSQALAWEGEFDVPCRFDTDELRYQMLGSPEPNRLYQLVNLPILEIRV